jgi:hypothetical protein
MVHGQHPLGFIGLDMLQSQKIREVSFTPRNLFFSTTAHSGCGCVEGCVFMENVFTLKPKERVRQDAEPIATIYRNLGTTSAEQVVTRALGELALTMAGLAAQVRAHEMGDLVKQLRRLQRMAENLGMVSLGVVAGDLRVCIDKSDATGFAAVWARLCRIAERSLVTDKELLDQTLV